MATDVVEKEVKGNFFAARSPFVTSGFAQA